MCKLNVTDHQKPISNKSHLYFFDYVIGQHGLDTKISLAIDILYFLPYCLIQDKACDAMEIFDELVESEVSIVTPHVKALIEFCLQVCIILFTVC